MGTQRHGAASFEYGPTTARVTVDVGTPLFEIRAASYHRRFSSTSADGSKRATLEVGNRLDELTGTIRLHDTARELSIMLDTALGSTEIFRYFAGYGSTAGIPTRLIAHTPMQPDRELAGQGLHEVTVTLRAWSSTVSFGQLYRLGRST